MNKKDALLKSKDLLSKMTIKEKAAQIAHPFYGFNMFLRNENNEIVLTNEIKTYIKENGAPGIISNLFRADPWTKKVSSNGGILIEEREKAYNLLQKYIVENTRLGIPAIFGEDDPHGRMCIGSPVYPVDINVGCSFSPETYYEVTKKIAEESIIGGNHLVYLSTIDLGIDPRWGRFEECFSEDPYLTSCYAEVAVKGVHDGGAMICTKHLAAQGANIGGHNGTNTNIGERELREIHLPAAKKACKSGTDFFMVAYNDIDGVPCHANSHLLKDIVRNEYGYDGIFYADACAIDNLVALSDDDYALAAAITIKAGMNIAHGDVACTKIPEAIEKGYLSVEELDEAVLPILEKKYEFGLFDNPYLKEFGSTKRFIDSKVGLTTSYKMASESLVLLKNNGVLPLKNKKILLIGVNTSDIYYMCGDYTSERLEAITLKDLITQRNDAYLEGWTFEKGITCSDEELEQKVKSCDVVLFGCGGSSARDYTSTYNNFGFVTEFGKKFIDCGEGTDLASLNLPQFQIDLLKKIKNLNKPIVSLLIVGRPYVIEEIKENSDAILWCGYPGEMSAYAILDTLLGKTNNFGKLSFSIPKHVGQIPVCYNYKSAKDYVDFDFKPSYAFGYGLSYSKFEYSNLQVKGKTINQLNNGESIEVSFKVKNISSFEGKEVCQLYIRKFGGTITHRLKELKRFDKSNYLPGEVKTINFTLNKDDLVDFSSENKLEIPSMTLTIMIGSSSDNILLNKKIKIL